MARVPENQQIVPENFKEEEQALVTKIADPFNTYVDQLNGILNKNLTFTDNFLGQVRTFTIQGDQSFKFTYDISQKPIGLWIIAYNNVTNPTEILTTGVTAQWVYEGSSTINVKRVSGLTAADKYNVTFIAISG